MIKKYFAEEFIDPEIPSVGWTCTYTPEEVRYAVGFHPFRLLEFTPSTKMADVYLHHNLCPYIRNCLDFGLRNENQVFRGIVIANSCDAMRCLFHSWLHHVSSAEFVYLMNIPKNANPHGIEYFTKEIHGLNPSLDIELDRTENSWIKKNILLFRLFS